jgi:hypothetical protein
MMIFNFKDLTCLGLLISGLFSSCTHMGSTNDLLNYALDPKNGLHQKEEKNGILVEVLYKPTQLIVAQEIKGQSLRLSQVDSIQRYFSEFDYFLLRLSRNGKEIETAFAGDQSKFNEANSYLSFEMAKDVRLIWERDTISTKDFIHTRTFGSSPSSDILFVFKSRLRDRNGSVKFIFDDRLFDSGRSEFDFAVSDIKSIPSITLTRNDYEIYQR